MPYFHPLLIDAALGIKSKEAERFAESGPGRLDCWALIDKGPEACWEQKSGGKDHSARRLQIMVSHAFLNKLEFFEYCVLSDIIETHDVFVFQPGIRYATAKPVENAAEFWQRIESAKPATQIQVAEELAQQGLAVDHYYIVDAAEYVQLDHRMNQLLDQNPDNVPPNKQRTIAQLSYTNFEFLDDYSQLENLRSGDSACLEETEVLILKNQFLISLKMDGVSSIKKIDLSQCPSLRHLEISNCQNLQHIHFGKLKLKQIEISDCPILQTSTDLFEEEKTGQSQAHSEVLSFSPVDSFGIDGQTKSSGSMCSHGSITLSVTSAEPISKKHYRAQIFDTVSYDEHTGRITLESDLSGLARIDHPIAPVNDPDFARCAKQAKEFGKPGHALIALTVEALQPGQWVALGDHQANHLGTPQQFFSDNPDAVELYWHEYQKIWYFTLKPGVPQQTISLYRFFDNNPSYEQADRKQVQPSQNPSLDMALIRDIEKNLNMPSSPVAFIFSNALDAQSKLEQLIHYCKHFEDKTLDNAGTNDFTLETLCKIIQEGKGSCRHRGFAFMVLSQYLNYQTHFIRNGLHAFCQLPSDHPGHPSEVQLQRLDLGGSDAVDSSPAVENPLDKALGVIEDPIEASYYQLLKQASQSQTLDHYEQLLQDPHPAHLILLNEAICPFSVNRKLAKILETVDNMDELTANHLYVDTPEELEKYFSAPVLSPEGQRNHVPGPLQRLINNTSQKTAVLVINWSNFSANQAAKVMSLLDLDENNRSQLRLCGRLKIIGLSTASKTYNPAFNRRSKTWCLSEALIPGPLSEAAESAEDLEMECIVIDLFGSHAWKQKLLGDITFSGHSGQLIEGALIQAIRENRPIIIQNPPEDNAEFDRLMNQCRENKKILYQGDLLSIPDNMTIDYEMIEHPMILDNVQVSRSSSVIDSNRIFLNNANWHELFKQLCIHPESQEAQERGGLLSIYRHFVISDQISASDWKELLNVIEEQYPEKQFNFVLTEHAGIENIDKHILVGEYQEEELKENPDEYILVNGYQEKEQEEDLGEYIWIDEYHEEEQKEGLETASIIISNDPDYLVQRLKEVADQSGKATPLIIDLTPKKGYETLIAKSILTEKSGGGIHFHYIEQPVLTALRAGRPVTLNGALSHALYQKLLPLLTTGTLVLNGKEERFPGLLRVVMPESIKAQYTPAHGFEQPVIKQDYVNIFSEDEDDIEKILAFYHFAQQLSHRGQGRPEEAYLSHQRISNMLEALKQRQRHPHNPIKGYFLYDYPKDSMEYAFLNVLGKVLFHAPEEEPAIRQAKLKRLYTQHFELAGGDDSSSAIWKLLNCFNGSAIQAHFPEFYQHIFSLPEEFSQLLKDIDLTQLKTMALADPDAITNEAYKPEQQLRAALAEKKPFLFLKGATGTSKTSTVKKLSAELSYRLYQGSDPLSEYLSAPPQKGEKAIILLDQANMSLPGNWNLLKTLRRNQILTPDTIVIATGNFEDQPQRHYHPLLQEFEAILFAQRSAAQLTAEILEPMGLDPEHREFLLWAYQTIGTYQPYFETSLSDLVHLVQRFQMLQQDAMFKTPRPTPLLNAGEERSEAIDFLLLKTVLCEFAVAISDLGKRQAFIEACLAKLPHANDAYHQEKSFEKPLTVLNNSQSKPFYLPQSQYILKEAIEQDLKMRESREVAQQSKQGVLLTGVSNTGKSTLLEMILQDRGYQEAGKEGEEEKDEAVDKNKRYYKVSAGDARFEQIARLAHQKGAVLILDELNLNAQAERLLADLFDTPKPGFFVLASENPGSYTGCEPSSDSLKRFFHVLPMNAHTESELTEIAEYKQHPHAKAYAKAFGRLFHEDSRRVTPALFHAKVSSSMTALPAC